MRTMVVRLGRGWFFHSIAYITPFFLLIKREPVFKQSPMQLSWGTFFWGFLLAFVGTGVCR